MFDFFRKKNKTPAEPKIPVRVNKMAFSGGYAMQPVSVRPEEPFTLAQYRLDHGANDFGHEKGVKLYNAHKTKVANQWTNPLQSINTGYGSAQYSFFNFQNINYYECYALAQDPLFNKIFDLLSKTPFANGGMIVDDEVNGPELQMKAEQRFRVTDLLSKAVRSSFVVGGCLVYMDFGSEENLEEPLVLKNADMSAFKGFKQIDPINITAVDVNTTNPAADDYMKPLKWYVIGLGTVHASRLLHFEQNAPEAFMRPLTLYFGQPLTLLIKQDVANSQLASQGLANLMNRQRYVYLKTSDENFVGAGAEYFRDRLEAMSMCQDNFQVTPLKTSEDILQLTTSLAGMADNVELFFKLIAAKTDITKSILLGEGASGLSGTLEGERKNFHDRIRRIQADVKANMLTMYGIIAGVLSDGKFKKINDYAFNPLETSSEAEKTNNLKTYLETARAMIEIGADQVSVWKWLKSMKDFNLDTVELDENGADASGEIGGYDDITNEVFEAWKNAKVENSRHYKRDEKGQFAEEDRSDKNCHSETKKRLVSAKINGRIVHIRELVLDKAEYGEIMHEITTHATEEQKKRGKFAKPIGGFIYHFAYDEENNIYYVIGKETI